MRITTLEQGFAGHFICASDCRFRRNTAVIFDEQNIKTVVIVSTVGDFRPAFLNGKREEIGVEREYETMCFRGYPEASIFVADVFEIINFSSRWSLKTGEYHEANEMHEKVVKEIVEKGYKKELIFNSGEKVFQ